MTDLSNELMVMAGELNTKTYAPKANGSGEAMATDPGIENMNHASGLSAEALEQSYVECAARAEAEIIALEKIHTNLITTLKEEAAASRARGAKVAQLIKDYGALAQTVASASAASTKALREAEPK